MDLRIPSTKRIGWEETEVETAGYDGVKDTDLSGIKSALKAGRSGKGKGRAAVKGDEWDLDLTTAGGRGVGWMEGREDLPVLVTLHLVCRFSYPCSDARIIGTMNADLIRSQRARRYS